MNNQVGERFQVSPFFVFYITTSMIIGMGILAFQRSLLIGAGYDSWIAVVLLGIVVHIIIRMIFYVLKQEQKDITEIHRWLFGKWIGGALTLCFCMYFFVGAFNIYRAYIEIVQVWMFPTMKTWQTSIILIPLIYYVLAGGFRTIVGICFWGVFIPIWGLLLLFIYPFHYANFSNLLPLMNHSVTDQLISMRVLVFEYLGFEVLLMYYPYIKKAERALKWAHLSVGVCTLMYALLVVLTFAYFSSGQLSHTIWPTLTMVKIIEVPFIQRFEYIAVSIWLLTVMPNICLALWSAGRGIKKVFGLRMKVSFIFMLAALFLLAMWLNERVEISIFVDVFSEFGFWLVFVYIPLLFVLVLAKRKWLIYRKERN
ncbi:GerAB/ArcD/ProY family transporter [Marinicrinis lubricantis]|uniref:GerAB/ArcD/ProY family transporter n=1 Tax=Marinicrinis lubricantis TaxID=2086470 RepID=A0ABW1ILA6_9BACL